MPRVTQDVLDGFGKAVRRARQDRNWPLKKLAERMEGSASEPFLSNIENGKRQISGRTVARLVTALDLPEVWKDRFARAETTPEEEETRADRDAQRLIAMAEKDPAAPPGAEALVIALAYEYAGGQFLDLQTAYAGLRGALQAAAEMRAELVRLHNLDDRLTAVLRRVADLNNQGLRDEAGDALDAAIKAKEAEIEALQDAALHQDRLLNRPATAAARVVKRLKASAPPGGVFNATQHLINETREHGKVGGDPYDLALALELAIINLDRARGPAIAFAQNDLGNCHLSLGERQAGGGHLTKARRVFSEALRLTNQRQNPRNWASLQNNLGNALSVHGKREGDPARLHEAVSAYRAALTVYTAETAPMDWAATQNNLGTALRSLGDREGDPARMHEAVAAYRTALTVRTPEAAPMNWATTQNNLGTALHSLGDREGDPARLHEAVAAYRAALTVYTTEAAPMDWAMTQNNLGTALHSLGDREGDPARLHEAVAAYRAALTFRTAEAAPMNWAMTQNNLGTALQSLGDREGDPARLHEAVFAYRAALTVHTEEAAPMDWAGSQNNIGLCFRWLGNIEANPAHFAAARDAYTASMTHRTRDTAPFLYARTQWNLADLSLAWHTLDSQPARLDTAQEHLDAARAVFAEAENTHQIAECDRLQRLIDEARAASGEAPPPPRGEG